MPIIEASPIYVGYIDGLDNRMNSIPKEEGRKLQIKIMLIIKMIVVLLVHYVHYQSS